MPHSFRPDSHAERDQVVAAVEKYVADPSADPTVVAIEAQVLANDRLTYQASRRDYTATSAASRVASAAADDADAGFDRCVRLVAASVRDREGKAVPATLAAIIDGVRPGELVKLRYREEVEKGETLVAGLRGRSDLHFDRDRLDDLETATATLSTATTTDEQATLARLASGRVLEGSIHGFDTSYGKFVRAFEAIAGEDAVAAVLPRFVRPDREEASVAAPVADAAPAPAAGEVPVG